MYILARTISKFLMHHNRNNSKYFLHQTFLLCGSITIVIPKRSPLKNIDIEMGPWVAETIRASPLFYQLTALR